MPVSDRLLLKQLVFIGFLGLILGGFWFLQNPRPEPEKPRTTEIPPLPPISRTPYLNALGEAKYVGRQVCAECHDDVDQTYQETAHAQALGPIDLSTEPHPAEFSVDSGKRSYRIFAKDGQLWHKESLKTSPEKELVLSEFPMRWVIGSGRFSKSYLAEIDGFLVQSPATWYRSRPGWSLSPGYERYNPGFERTTELRCIHCHVGRAEPKEGSFHRLTIHTQAIDCERCHGPGSLHAAQRSEGIPLEGEDFSIVHPGRLDRERAESICAQCHLHGAATVDLRGRQLSEFRPSLSLTDFAIPYGLESPGQQMKVVGHMEQMRLSRCYQASNTLTCTTCHNPHQTPDASERVSYYRKTCLSCHDETACGLEKAERVTTHADDNCLACHMPESPTDIPHFAFTHHRIGVHQDASADELDAGPQKLVPLADVSGLSLLDQDRNLGLAYLQVADHHEHRQHAEFYHNQARRLLMDVRARGLRDLAVDAALSRLYWQVNAPQMTQVAQAVLDSPRAMPEDRATALFTLGTTAFQQGQFQQAAPLFEEIVQIRRYADAWHVLGICREEQGNLDGAIEAAMKAAEISPLRPDFQQRLIELYGKTDRTDLARKHLERLRDLETYHKSRD